MEENKIEDYKIINERINKQIEEFYSVNSIFLLISSGLLTANIFKDTKLLVYLGIIISFLWLISLFISLNYRNEWIERAKKLEDEDGVWRNSPKIFPPLMKVLMILPIIFGIIWFMILK